MINQRVHYSVVEFRSNPADENAALLLGFLIGFQTEKLWAVGMAMRGSLPRKLLEHLDPLSQAMLNNRSEIVKSQLQDQFEFCSNPEQVLDAVSRENFTSFYVTAVQSAMLELFVQPSGVSTEKIAEDFVVTLFHRNRAAVAARSDSYRVRSNSLQKDFEQALPPPWMTGTQVWWRPNS